MKNEPTILAIDTSCDETSVAVVRGRRVFANVIASQVELQKKYGGVYPIEAKRQHEKVIDAVVEEALTRALKYDLRFRNNENMGILKQVQDDNFKIDAVVEEAVRRAKSKKQNLKNEILVDEDLSTSKKSRISPVRGEKLIVGGEIQLDAVAVTAGPGLAPALEVGIRKARELAEKWNVPRVAVNHMEGHLLAPLAQNAVGGGKYESNGIMIQDLGVKIQVDLSSSTKSRVSPVRGEELTFPVLGLLVSGGHTEIILMNEIGKYEILGEKLDDAAGECLDKVARMLGLGYPGGAVIEDLAKQGKPGAIKFPIPMKGKPGLDFSFSGLKTAALYEIRSKSHQGDEVLSKGSNEMVESVQWGRLENLDRQYICDVCLAVQETVIKALVYRLEQAVEINKPKWVFLGGGVGVNVELRKALRKMLKKHKVKLGLPYSDKLYGDNAAMIGLVASFKFARGEFEEIESVERRPRWKIGEK